MKTNKGFTLIEMIVGLAIAVILGLISLQFLTQYQNSTKRLEKVIDYKIDALLADKIILKDFRLAFPSLNQIRVIDDNSKSFFDKYDKVDSTTGLDTSDNSSENDYTRIFRLDADTSVNKNMYMLLHDMTRGEMLYAEPVTFYDIGPPADINTPAPLTFNEAKLKSYIASKNGKMLETGSLVYIESSVPMPKTPGNYNSKLAAFLAKVSAAGMLELYNPPDNIFSFNIYSKSVDGSEVITPITSLDQFLRELPASANGGSNIRIVPVKLISYNMNCTSIPDITNPLGVNINCNLWRGEYFDGTLKNKRPILNNIKSVTFVRKNILANVTNVRYEKADKQ